MTKGLALLALVMLCTCPLTGCLGEPPSDFHYTVEDAEGEASSLSSEDALFTITLSDRGEVNMKFSSLSITVKQDGTAYQCLAEGEGGNCTVSQPSGSDDTLWEENETLVVSESGTDICGRTCIITFTVQGPEGSQTTGPTILTIS